MSDTSDPDAVKARVQSAAESFGKAWADSIKLSFRQGVAKQIADEFGPGPWILHEDGRVELIPAKPTPKPRVRRVK